MKDFKFEIGEKVLSITKEKLTIKGRTKIIKENENGTNEYIRYYFNEIKNSYLQDYLVKAPRFSISICDNLTGKVIDEIYAKQIVIPEKWNMSMTTGYDYMEINETEINRIIGVLE